MHSPMRLGLILAVVFLYLADFAHAFSIETVAFTGQPAPGTGDGIVFNSFEAPTINAVGRVAFRASVTGPGIDFGNNRGIWSNSAGVLRLVARGGDPAPGLDPGVEMDTSWPVFNAAGQTAFLAILDGTGVDSSNSSSVWSEAGGSLALVAREGDPAPGMPGGVSFDSFLSKPVLNDTGQTAFWASLDGIGIDSSNNSGVWSEGGGFLGLVAREGFAAPGTPPGVDFDNFTTPHSRFFQIVLNDAGQTAFSVGLTGTGVDSSNDSGIWSGSGGSVRWLVAREGDAAPGTAPGTSFAGFYQPDLNATGQTVFSASLAGTGVDTMNDTGIWSEGSGSLQLVAREGSPAPGTAAGVQFADFGSVRSPVLNAAGRTAFLGHLTGAGVVPFVNSRGIWSGGSGSLKLIAREGSRAPGTPVGVTFGGFHEPALNGAGQTAFDAVVEGPGVDGSNDLGIWAEDRTGLKPVVREGQSIEVSPGDFRTVSLLSMWLSTGNSDGRRSGFSNGGVIAFTADFTDGSEGVFRAVPDTDRRPAPIPASTTWGHVLLTLILAAALLRKSSLLRRRLGK